MSLSNCNPSAAASRQQSIPTSRMYPEHVLVVVPVGPHHNTEIWEVGPRVVVSTKCPHDAGKQEKTDESQRHYESGSELAELLGTSTFSVHIKGSLQWACLDLNQGPHPYQGCALTRLSYRPEGQER